MASQQLPVGPDTPIVIKVTVNEASIRKFKLPMRDLGASVLPDKVRLHLPLMYSMSRD